MPVSQKPSLGRYCLRLGLFGLVVAFLFVQYQKEAIGALFFVAGRTTAGCSWQGAVGSVRAFDSQIATNARLVEQNKLLETTADGLQRWQTPSGIFWVPAGGSNVLTGDLAEQQRGIYSSYGLGVKPGDVVLDCGANIGLYSKVALEAGASQVIAIEPVPANLECLRRNLADEISKGSVVIVPKGVWHKDDVLDMYQEANVAAHSFVLDIEKRGQTIRLPLTTIDKVVGELGLKRVDYIKMDIEGAERHALDGGMETLRRFHPRMALCVYHLPDDPQVIPDKVHAAWEGFRYRCGPCMANYGKLSPEVFFFF